MKNSEVAPHALVEDGMFSSLLRVGRMTLKPETKYSVCPCTSRCKKALASHPALSLVLHKKVLGTTSIHSSGDATKTDTKAYRYLALSDVTQAQHAVEQAAPAIA